MVAERNPQPRADIGQPGRSNIPHPARNRHGADERVWDRRQTVAHAAAAQDSPVEWRIMGRQELYRADAGLDPRPDLAEGRGRTDVRPGEAVHGREGELGRHRSDQLIDAIDDAAVIDDDHPEGTGTVGPWIGGLEVDRREPARPRGRPAVRGPALATQDHAASAAAR